MSSLASAAAAYVAEGLAILPLRPQSKRPATSHGKNDASADAALTALRFPKETDQNIGILTGAEAGLLVVDIDPRNGGEEAFARLERTFGKLPETRKVMTGGDGVHLYFRVPCATTGLSDRPNVAGYQGVDLKAGGYVVAPPSIHESGKAYELANDLPIACAPDWLIRLGQGGRRIRPAASNGNGTIKEGGRNDTLFRMACALRSRGLGEDAVLAAILAENERLCSPPLDQDECERIGASAMRYEPSTAHPDTDLGNARRLVDRMDGAARYEPASRAWFVWDGRRWRQDAAGEVTQLAKAVADQLLFDAGQINDPETSKRRLAFANRSQGIARIKAMIDLAETEPGVPISFGQFDRQPHFLNVANGMVDLRSGALVEPDHSAFITNLIDVDFDADARCPVFESFLFDVLSGDEDLIEFVHRAIGYAATGETREQCFFILHGEGANGKSTFLNVIRGLLGEYAKHTPTDTLVSKSGGASNDLARLAGARFVTASEANADQRMADALVKQITGDEPITARLLYREFITFQPTFKLFLATNQLPQVSGNDPAMWRRIRTIPFDRVFQPEEQDHTLAEKLAAERSGILAWIMRGAVKWYADGLTKPDAISRANAEYRAEMDSVGQFIAERCHISRAAEVSASVLYNSYRRFANDNGHSPVSQTMFGRTLTSRGFNTIKRGGIFRTGLTLQSNLLEA